MAADLAGSKTSINSENVHKQAGDEENEQMKEATQTDVDKLQELQRYELLFMRTFLKKVLAWYSVASHHRRPENKPMQTKYQ